MEPRQSSEFNQRRQVYARINELKSSCKHYTIIRDDLSNRLSELNKVVDHLIAEKRVARYDPHLKIDSTSFYHINTEPSQSYKSSHRSEKQPDSSTNNDLNVVNYDNSSSRRDPNYSDPKSSSDAFKIKLSHCLQEIEPKAKEIFKHSERLRR